MLKFHNKVCDQLASAGKPADAIFTEARRIVTWHYQWMVLHDFVERITEKGIVAKILHAGPPVLPLQGDARTCRSSSPAPRIASATAWCARPTATTASSRSAPAVYAGDAGAAVPVHRAVGRHHRRAGAQSTDGADADLGAVEQLDHRLAPLLRVHDAAIPPDVTLNASRKLDPFVVAGAAHAAGRRRQPAVPQSASAASCSDCRRDRTSPRR